MGGVGLDYRPSVSPDGSTVLFASTRGMLTGDPDRPPSWVWDGDSYAHEDLYTVGWDGTGLRRLTDRGDTRPDAYGRPRFSPDGTRIVAERRQDASPHDLDDLVILDLEGGILGTLDPYGGFTGMPAWGP